MQQENSKINNVLKIKGKVVSEYSFSHEIYGEGFYTFDLEVPRLSDFCDILPVTISERIMEAGDFGIGQEIILEGQIRSYNSYSEEEQRNRLILTIFARDYEKADCEEENKSINEIFLNGFLCKAPVYRTTPFGREICDLLVAVNRSYNKSDYIPCICWGRNARFAGKLEVGENIKISGRMQSREYQKKSENGEVENRMAYEVSVFKIELSEVKE